MSTPLRLFAAVATAFSIAACTAGAPTASPAAAPVSASPGPTVAAPPVASSPAPTPVPSFAPSIPLATATASVPASASTSASASGPTATVTDWGVIWDALPAGFPRYPGARPAVTGGGPASAIFDLPADGQTASTWYQAALRTAGFEVTGASGPREDGSYDVTATMGTPDCQTEISLAPLGSTTTATIYLAAACPFA